MAITISFPISVLVHSLLVMQWSSWNSTSTFGHRRHHHGWSATVGCVTNILFTSFKKTDPASNWANINGILTLHTSQTFIGLEPSAEINSVTSLYLIHTCTSTILHGYCLDHTIPWSTTDPDGAGQWHYLVGKARSFARHIYKKNRRHNFLPTFICTRFHQNFLHLSK
jgi:hypothetical protein